MLAEYLAIALRNSRLYGEIADTKRSLEQLIASAGEAIIAVTPDDRIDGWNPAAERIFGLTVRQAMGRSDRGHAPRAATTSTARRQAGRTGAARTTFEVTTAPPAGPAARRWR